MKVTNMKILCVGDIGNYLAEYAGKINRNATLVSQGNYNNFINSTDGVFYTSLGEFDGPKIFCSVLLSANEIILSLPPTRSDDTDDFTLESETKEHLYMWSLIKDRPVKNLKFNYTNPEFGRQFDLIPRVTPATQIWNTGCSITHGDGIEIDQRYGNIIADQLKLPITNLSCSGSSIIWAGDTILSADIKPGDIVIWGLTSWQRYSYFLHKDRFYHITHRFVENYPLIEHIININWLVSPHNLYQSIKAINAVQHFCDKIGAKLILAGLLTTDTAIDTHLINCPNYIEFKRNWADKGTDNMHPGPKQHQIFAKNILKLL